MWKQLAILIGGYGFIVVSYASTCMIAAVMSQYVETGRVERLERADVKAVLGMSAVWTIAWAVIMIAELVRVA